MIKKIIDFLSKYLSDEEKQEKMLDYAEDLAKKTPNEIDDNLVSIYRDVRDFIKQKFDI